jgi:hypothetical protein
MMDFLVVAGGLIICCLVVLVPGYYLAKLVHEAAEAGLDINLPEVPHMPHIDGGD